MKTSQAKIKLGVKHSVVQDMKRVGVGLMDEDELKIKGPSGHPSDNKSQKQGTTDSEKQGSRKLPQHSGNSETSHETLKAGVSIFATVSAFLIYKLK